MLDKNSLKERIGILQNAGVIADDIAAFGEDVVDDLDPEFDQTTCEMYITHLVMALNRVRNSEPIESLDASIFEEVTTDENFGAAVVAYNELKAKMPYELPRQEEEFLLVHLTHLSGNKSM